MNDEQQQTSQWAVVELFGHKTIAGQITKDASLFPMLRIDVPATGAYPAYTAEYGPAAVYGITYVSEDVAKAMAESLKVNPIKVYGPDLVTREQFEKEIDAYEQKMAQLRRLPAPPPPGTPEEGSSFDDEEEDRDDDF